MISNPSSTSFSDWVPSRLGRTDLEERPTSCFADWDSGMTDKVADEKEGRMFVRGIRRITDSFPASLDGVKELCMELRSILLGDTAEIFLATPEVEDDLYVPILQAFDKTILKLPMFHPSRDSNLLGHR